jgi:transposase
MKTYSLDFRERALGALDRGHSLTEVAEVLGVGTATLKRWRRLRRETGSLAPKPKRGRPPQIRPEQHPALVAQIQAHPDATLAEHCEAWAAATTVRLSPATLCRLLQKLGLPLTKTARGQRARRGRPRRVAGRGRHT